jgi:hypothetical protein
LRDARIATSRPDRLLQLVDELAPPARPGALAVVPELAAVAKRWSPIAATVAVTSPSSPRWTASPSSVGRYTSLHSVSGNARDDVWSVGDLGTIVHWDGTAWSTVPSSTTLDLEGVWAHGADDICGRWPRRSSSRPCW